MIDVNIILLMLKKVKPEYVCLCDKNVKISRSLCCDNMNKPWRNILFQSRFLNQHFAREIHTYGHYSVNIGDLLLNNLIKAGFIRLILDFIMFVWYN